MKIKNELKNKKGITLIALVITIIVLLILAGVSIATLTGPNGLLTRANQAKTETEEAKEDELRRLTALEAATNIDGTTHTETITQEGADEPKTVTVKIPAGFAVSQVEGENTIADGLVVIDKNGNEFVWIPVDGVLWDEGTSLEDVTEDGKLLLGRYVFDENGKIDTDLTPKTIGGQLRVSSTTSSYYTEDTTGKGNAVATGEDSINSFIQSVRDNGGYYIGRYEAGDAKATTNRDSNSSDNNPLVVKSGQYAYNWVSQIQASELCQDLYSEVNSDLVNSYAWDTAILFIQKFSGDINYSIQTRLQTTVAKTGEANDGENNDVRCNIYDMAGNYFEWSTETSNYINSPCVGRGGYFDNIDFCVRIRSSQPMNSLNDKNDSFAFRPILYL